MEYFLRIINWLVLAASLPNQFLLASYRDPQNILSKCDTTCISWTEWEVLNKLLNWYLHICNVKLRYWNRCDDVITSCYLEIKIYLPFSPCYRPCYCCYASHEISDLSTITLCHYILNTSNIYICHVFFLSVQSMLCWKSPCILNTVQKLLALLKSGSVYHVDYHQKAQISLWTS